MLQKITLVVFLLYSGLSTLHPFQLFGQQREDANHILNTGKLLYDIQSLAPDLTAFCVQSLGQFYYLFL